MQRVRPELPTFDATPVRSEMCAWTESADDRFIIDRVGDVVVACGDSGQGFKFLPMFGEVLADLVEETALPGGGGGRRRLARRWPDFAGGRCRQPSIARVTTVSDLEMQFRSDMTVELVRAAAQDADVLFAARVSTLGEQSLDDVDADAGRSEGLIRYLMRDRHGSPFEHNSMTFYVQAPIFVFREFMRHRIASYNEESGRYRELRPVFYVPAPERKLVQEGKPGHYVFVDGTDEQHATVVEQTKQACASAYEAYQEMLDGRCRARGRARRPAGRHLLVDVRDHERPVADELPVPAHQAGGRRPSRPTRSGRSRWSPRRWRPAGPSSCR